MKKRCRVYKPSSMQQGGENKIAMTQDSQKDNVPQEKNNNFMQWLHTASNAAQVDKMIEQDIQMINAGYMQVGGPVMYAQNGVSFPGIMPLITEVDDTPWADNKHNPYATSPEAFEGFADQEQYNPEDDYTTAPEAQTAEMTPGQPNNNQEGKVDPFGMSPRNANIAQGMITGINAGAAFGDLLSGKNADAERQFKAKASDPFRTNATAPSDRGDYMANVPGIGNNFRPDEHTRMGYNTKIAQEGGEHNLDDEMELSEAEINNLIAQGYNLEYLD